jgi:hypothetical protein
MEKFPRNREASYDGQPSYSVRTELILAYGTWVWDFMDKGWKAYLVTFMFNQLPGGREAIIRQMTRSIEETFYPQLVKRVVRKTRSHNWLDVRPILICCPDVPAFKYRKKVYMPDLATNDGLHLHAIILIPPEARGKLWNAGLIRHIASEQHIYVGCNPKLQRIQVERIQSNPAHPRYKKGPQFTTGYALKAARKGDH